VPFVRAAADVTQVISLNIARFQGEIHVAVRAEIRFDAVEQLLQRARAETGDELAPLMASLGTELGNSVSRQRRVWQLPAELDIEASAEQMVALIEDVAVPMYERYGTIEVAYGVFTGEDADAALLAGAPHAAAARALAVAVLRNDRVQFESLRERFSKLMEDGRDPVAIREFRTAAAGLASELPHDT
jgi:hypothetical protein